MNTHLDTVKILCYGDSNTWGHMPATEKRYDTTIRWTGRLQQALGEHYEIIEEGLNGRTTILDDPNHEGKNGATYLKPCLQTHAPLDIVILMLGTNDLQEIFARTPDQIAQSVDALLAIIHNLAYTYHKQPKVILLSPPLIDESIQRAQQYYKGAEAKSKQLALYYQKVAKKYNAAFINVADYLTVSKEDGSHLDPEAHKRLSEIVEEKIRDLDKTVV